MARCVEATVSEDVPAPVDQVRAHYVDLDNITDVHPLVVSVHTLSRRDTDDGFTHTYRVRDRIPMGVATLPISYTATLRVPRTGVARTAGGCPFRPSGASESFTAWATASGCAFRRTTVRTCAAPASSGVSSSAIKSAAAVCLKAVA